MRFEGDVVIKAPHQKVWEFFTNVGQVASCIPGCEKTEEIGDGKYKALVVEKLGPFRVSFDMEVSLDEVEEPRRIKASVNGKDTKLGSTLRQDMEVILEELGPEETKVTIAAEINVLGKLGSLGYGIIKRKADETLKNFAEAARQRLEGGQ